MIDFTVCDFKLALNMSVLIWFGGSLWTGCKTSLNDRQLTDLLSCELILGFELVELVLEFLSESIRVVVCVIDVASRPHQSFDPSELSFHLFDFLF